MPNHTFLCSFLWITFGVHWGYMFNTFKKFGFKGPIFSSILALYSLPSALVYTSSIPPHSFLITNCIRQVCPLSPTIFNLFFEPLAEAIRSHHDIYGFTFKGRSHVNNLFADDVKLFQQHTSLATAHDIVTSFSQISY